MIGVETQQMMMVVMAFSGGELVEVLDEAEALLVEFVRADKAHTRIL